MERNWSLTRCFSQLKIFLNGKKQKKKTMGNFHEQIFRKLLNVRSCIWMYVYVLSEYTCILIYMKLSTSYAVPIACISYRWLQTLHLHTIKYTVHCKMIHNIVYYVIIVCFVEEMKYVNLVQIHLVVMGLWGVKISNLIVSIYYIACIMCLSWPLTHDHVSWSLHDYTYICTRYKIFSAPSFPICIS